MCFCFPRFLVKTELNYNLEFAINIVILGTKKKNIKMILLKGKQSMECFWSFFHTIGLNFKTLAHFFPVAIRFNPGHRKPNTNTDS